MAPQMGQELGSEENRREDGTKSTGGVGRFAAHTPLPAPATHSDVGGSHGVPSDPGRRLRSPSSPREGTAPPTRGGASSPRGDPRTQGRPIHLDRRGAAICNGVLSADRRPGWGDSRGRGAGRSGAGVHRGARPGSGRPAARAARLCRALDVLRVHYLEIPSLALRAVVRRDPLFRNLHSTKELGASVAPDGSNTTFRVFSPRAEAVRLHLYDEGDDSPGEAREVLEMARDADGVWEATLLGDLHGTWRTLYEAEAGARTGSTRPTPPMSRTPMPG